MYYTPGHLCPGECSTSLLAIFVAFPVDNAILPFYGYYTLGPRNGTFALDFVPQHRRLQYQA